MMICQTCQLPDPGTGNHVCIDSQRLAMVRLLELVGEAGTCRGCGVPIYWVNHRNGKKAPYTFAGLNHFVDCKAAKEFKR